MSLEDFKSIVLPYELLNLEELNLTDEEIESKRRIARMVLNDAKFQEYEKFKIGSSLNDIQIKVVQLQTQLDTLIAKLNKYRKDFAHKHGGVY